MGVAEAPIKPGGHTNMARWHTPLLLAGFVFGLASSAHAATMVICHADDVELRAKPSLKAALVKDVMDFEVGYALKTVGPKQGNWQKVQDPKSGKEGFVQVKMLCRSSNTASGPDDAVPSHAATGGAALSGGGSGGGLASSSVSPSSATSFSPSQVAPSGTVSSVTSGPFAVTPGVTINTCGFSSKALASADKVAAQITGTGGYRFDRRVWAALGVQLPVNDAPDSKWAPITNWADLRPGDVLATAQGHAWGADWHGGLFLGMINGAPWIFDNSPGNSNGGAEKHPLPMPGYFSFYYVPTHNQLSGSSCSKQVAGR